MGERERFYSESLSHWNFSNSQLFASQKSSQLRELTTESEWDLCTQMLGASSKYQYISRTCATYYVIGGFQPAESPHFWLQYFHMKNQQC